MATRNHAGAAAMGDRHSKPKGTRGALNRYTLSVSVCQKEGRRVCLFGIAAKSGVNCWNDEGQIRWAAWPCKMASSARPLPMVSSSGCAPLNRRTRPAAPRLFRNQEWSGRVADVALWRRL
jgi:hypothetical protein